MVGTVRLLIGSWGEVGEVVKSALVLCALVWFPCLCVNALCLCERRKKEKRKQGSGADNIDPK